MSEETSKSLPDYKNILVINLMHLGDLMLVTPVLRTLRSNYPKARLTLLADKKLADLVQYNKNLDECLLIDKKGKDDHIGSFYQFIKKVRSKHYDLVINLHRNERASALAAFSGAKRIVGYSKPGFSLFFTKVLPNLKAVKHQIHSHFDVLEQAVGIDKIDDRGLEMWLPEKAEQEAASLWEREVISSEDTAPKVIAFNIGASWKTKRWLDSYFSECADELIDEGYTVAFFGGPMDREIVDKCLSEMKHKDSDRVKIFTGRVSLAVLAGLLKRCALFLTTDSGPMHVGVAMNVPVVTMFGASPVPGFYPYDAKDILIKTPDKCHPCGIHECPKNGEDNLACMKHMTPDIIMKYVHQLLEETGGRPAYTLPEHQGQYKCRVIEL